MQLKILSLGAGVQSSTLALMMEKGLVEKPDYAKGTLEIAKLLANQTTDGAITIVGGGDSVAAVNISGLDDNISHISTGGGASLELLSGYQLPGLVALTDKRNVS